MNKLLDPLETLAMHSVIIQDFSLDYLTGGQGWLRILREVSLSIGRGEVVGLVGESGCGKSSLAYNLLGYRAQNSRIGSGHVRIGETEMGGLSRAELDKLRGRRVALVPQNPTTALSPHLRIRNQLAEVLLQHGYATEVGVVEARLRELLVLVGLTDTARMLNSFPHELSGGQQQRVVIAMALSCDPDVLVLDEPTTGLDVTTQGQIVRLLGVLKQKIGLAMLYVTHDLNVLSQIADRVVVMYAGSVVETAPVRTIFTAPAHPYTRGLIGSIPDIRQTARNGMRLQGILRRSEIGAGCPFAARCAYRQPSCDAHHPVIEAIDLRHEVACHFWHDLPAYDPAPTLEAGKVRDERSADEVLRVKDMAIFYGQGGLWARLRRRVKSPVVRGVSLVLRKGEIVSLVGESGSGKSTIAKAITGMVPTVRLLARRQIRTVGGSAETEAKALTVAPWRPAAPSVVTTVTEQATCRIALMKAPRVGLCASCSIFCSVPKALTLRGQPSPPTRMRGRWLQVGMARFSGFGRPLKGLCQADILLKNETFLRDGSDFPIDHRGSAKSCLLSS